MSRKRRWLGMNVAAALLAVLCTAANAQTTVVTPSPAQRCLTRGELLLGTPIYPQKSYEEKASGRVTVELEFRAADAAPRVLEIEAKTSDGSVHADRFERAVRDFIGAYRVPCLALNETARLKQEFVFVPHDGRGVTLMASSDEATRRAGQLLRCLRHQEPKKFPEYPISDLRAERQGTVVVRLEFLDADGPARIKVLDDGGGTRFDAVVSAYAAGYRLPCHDLAGPVDMMMLYVFKLEGAQRVILKDVPLLTLVRAFKGIRSANVFFDLNTMSCPFDLRFTPMQPHAPNTIGEIGDTNPERRFFLDWLSRQQLDLPKREVNALLGQHAVVSVPCTVINLGQRTGGGASQ